MRKNIFKSVASCALSLALVLSATAIFSTFTASALDTNPKTFDFEDTVLGDGDKNSAFSITDEAWHGTEASGKSMLIYKDSIASPGYHKALLTTEKRATGEQYNVEWGKTYKVTLYYKTAGTFDNENAWSLGIFTGKKDGFINGSTNQTLDNSLDFPKEATEWTKFETTFTATENDETKQGNTCLGIAVNFPVFSGNKGENAYAVYIDDVTVAETDQKLFNFEETVISSNSGIANSAFTISADQNHGSGAGKSLKIERTTATTLATNMGALLTTKAKDGEQYKVEWGKTYKVTLWYKTVGTAPSESWMLGVSTGPIAFSGKRTAQSISNPLMLPTTGTDWAKYETTFTATFTATGSGENNYLGLSVYFPAFDAYSGDYAVYIDDVTVESTDTAIEQSSTKTFDFGLIQNNISGYANTAFTGSTEQYRGNAANGKSIKIWKDKITLVSTQRAMLTLKDKTDTNFVYNVEWGKTYKVTLWYKTVGTFDNENAWSIGINTGSLDGFINGSTNQTLGNSLDFPKEATEWTKFETTFTATENDETKQGNTCLGIAVNFPVFSGNEGENAYAVYIDDVTVSEIEIQKGDVNCDGTVGIEDFNLLRQVLLGNAAKNANCYVNDDNNIDICDLVALDELLKNK